MPLLLRLRKPLLLLPVLMPLFAGLQADKAAALVSLAQGTLWLGQQQPADCWLHLDLCISKARLIAGILHVAMGTGMGR